MDNSKTYMQLLRPVGQALESSGMESFLLIMEEGAVLVKGHRRREKAPDPSSAGGFWRFFRSRSEVSSPGDGAAETVELRYSYDELSRMDEEGRAKRGQLATADAHSLPQIIRAVGAFVDQKQARLVSVRKELQKIEVEYESAASRRTEEFSVPSLYEFWVQMYLKRRNRTEPAS